MMFFITAMIGIVYYSRASRKPIEAYHLSRCITSDLNTQAIVKVYPIKDEKQRISQSVQLIMKNKEF